jgi:hypothetical protein
MKFYLSFLMRFFPLRSIPSPSIIPDLPMRTDVRELADLPEGIATVD